MRRRKLFSHIDLSRLFFLLLIAAMFSCKKQDQVFTSSISVQGTVKHHSWTVGYVNVYMKANATVYPGPNPAAYDTVITAYSNGDFLYSNLAPGNYYFFAKGFDPI